MQTLSIKKLRENFPYARKQLKNGQTILLIYKSEPIAKLVPVNEVINFKEASDGDIEKAAIADLGNEYLSDNEIKYYLALPDK